MKIIAHNTAISTFSSIGIKKEHANNMQSKTPNQHIKASGLVRKKDYECAAPEIMRKNETARANEYKNVNKSANIAFGGFFNAKNIATSNVVKKGLEFASDNGALFAAGVALLTTVLLRPMAIFATPGVKEENKQYACAQSIASGVIGFGIMAILSTPIAQAIKKINKNPEKYLKKETIAKLSDGADLVKSKKYGFSTQLFKLGADFVSAVPKALLTCALIPPIMVCLFPKRKQQDNGILYFKSGAIDNRSSQIFKGFIQKG